MKLLTACTCLFEVSLVMMQRHVYSKGRSYSLKIVLFFFIRSPPAISIMHDSSILYFAWKSGERWSFVYLLVFNFLEFATL